MSAYPNLRLFIGGEWKAGDGQPVLNPADDSVLAVVPHASRVDLDAALEAAGKGYQIWSRTSPMHRAEIILTAVKLMRERVENMAIAMTLEQGKPIAQSRAEILRGCEFIEWDAQEGRRVYGRIIPSEPGMRHSVQRQPIGVVAAFSPWNFPVASPARKVGGALSAGCSIVLKASEETPAGAVQLAQAFADAGLPAGVLNLVFGNPQQISDHLIPSPVVRLVSFTGSIAVGRQLAALSGAHLKPAIMELGGHAPVIVCDDVDPDAVAAKSVVAKARNAGQVCVSPTRFFVADAIYDRFAAAFVEQAASIRIGNGMDATTQMGPLANRRRMEAMEILVADAGDLGATVATGGTPVGNIGNFYPLTVITDVSDELRAMREEPFGPIALLSRVRNLEEAISRANSIPYGLAAYCFTDSAANVSQVVDGIEVGNLSINHFVASVAETPFGGVKESGFGREGGVEGVQSHTVAKNISHLMIQTKT